MGSAPLLLPIIARPATTSPRSLMPHQACCFTKKTVAIRQLSQLPASKLTDSPSPTPTLPVSVEQAWFLLRRPLLPPWAPNCISWPHVFPGSFPSVYRWAQAPYFGVLALDGLSARNPSPHLTLFSWSGLWRGSF